MQTPGDWNATIREAIKIVNEDLNEYTLQGSGGSRLRWDALYKVRIKLDQLLVDELEAPDGQAPAAT